MIVQGGLVEDDGVLIQASAPDAETRTGLARHEYAREQLHGLDDIRFAQKGRDPLDHLRGEIDHAHGVPLLVVGPPAADFHALQQESLGLEKEIPFRILVQIDLHGKRGIAQATDFKGVLPGRQGKLVIAVLVRGGPFPQGGNPKGRPDHRIAGMAVLDFSRKDARLLGRQQRGQEKQKEECRREFLSR